MCFPIHKLRSDSSESGYSNESDAETNIGIVGESGSGKSSFINAILRNKNTEIAGAVVSNPTTEPKCYDHPQNPRIKLWDLPGVGTAAYPDAKTYFNKLQLADQYHAFLLFTRERLTINSLRLAIRLESAEKPFFVIRTCIDVDVDSEKATKPETFNEDEMTKTIRSKIWEGLKDVDSVSREQIFLISNLKPKKWDFDRLNGEILYELPCNKAPWSSAPIGFTAQCKLAKLSLKEKQEKLAFDKEASLQSIKRYMPEKTSGIESEGITHAQNLMKEEIDDWKNVKISLAIIGNSGTGKSTFINAIRGIKKFDDKDPDVAKTGTTETTMTPNRYHYKNNPNITLWDCPGVGTVAFPDIETYCNKISIEKYDAFVIMTATRFSKEAGILASKVQSMQKPFFFVRTKIDQDYVSENWTKGLAFNEVRMLDEIKEECSTNLNIKEVEIDDKDIFLISSLLVCRWDFARLTEAITNRLHSRKRECFLLSMLSLSENILESKIRLLKGRVWAVAFFQSIIMKPFSRKENSRKRDFQQIVKKVEYYRLTLGFPKQDSEEFKMMSDVMQSKVRKFYLTSEINVEAWLSKFNTESDNVYTKCGDEDTKLGDEDKSSEEESLSWLDVYEAIKAPYSFVFSSLHFVLDEMGKIAVEILRETAARSQPDFVAD